MINNGHCDVTLGQYIITMVNSDLKILCDITINLITIVNCKCDVKCNIMVHIYICVIIEHCDITMWHCVVKMGSVMLQGKITI